MGLIVRAAFGLFIFVAVVTAFACGADAPTEEELRGEVVSALDILAAELSAEPLADTAGYVERLRVYLDAHSTFYGAAAALLDADGGVIASPYVYRGAGGYVTLDLAEPSYDIESQAWFTAPLAANAGVWTEPYFDAGGGEIWMVTRSVPVRNERGIFAIITTDLPVDDPAL